MTRFTRGFCCFGFLASVLEFSGPASCQKSSFSSMQGPGRREPDGLALHPSTATNTNGPKESTNDEHFNLLLQIQQLQDKCAYLAGGTDGVQLAEVLMEKEEECRMKDREIAVLYEKVKGTLGVVAEMEKEKEVLKGVMRQQESNILDLTQQVRLISFHIIRPYRRTRCFKRASSFQRATILSSVFITVSISSDPIPSLHFSFSHPLLPPLLPSHPPRSARSDAISPDPNPLLLLPARKSPSSRFLFPRVVPTRRPQRPLRKRPIQNGDARRRL